MKARDWFSVEDIARVCHEANRELQVLLGDPVSPPWDECDVTMQESVKHGVRVAQEGNGPQELHRQWRMVREALGWVYGPEKDAEEKTHPNLVDWNDLPPLQRAKDQLFHAVVSGLAEPIKESESQ